MLKQHVIRVQKDICSLAIIHPDFISEDTASATSALSAEWIKKQVSILHKDDALPSAPFPKGFKRSEDQPEIERKETVRVKPWADGAP